MGITITIGGIAGLPLLVMSGPIIEKFGHANVIFVGFLVYAVRLIGMYDSKISCHLLIGFASRNKDNFGFNY